MWGRTRVEVSPLRAGGLRWLLRLALWLGLHSLVAATLAGGAAYVVFSQGLPSLESLVRYQPRQLGELLSAEGFVLARVGEERREVLPPEALPLRLRQAFLAAEDADFYQHPGIDPAGILRAALQVAEGALGRGRLRYRQGGSTISQQLARTLLSREKTLVRKAREAILTLRLEAVLTKDQILWTYLNEVYLGLRAHGVGAAARAYFGRRPDELDLGQMAYLAGLPQRPSVLAKDHQLSLRRAEYVLEQMVAHGWASAEEKAAALASGIPRSPARDPRPWRAPYATEAALRALHQALGPALEEGPGGLRVETTIELAEQATARAALVRSLRALDQRQGYRGPLAHLDPAAASALATAWAGGQGFTPGPDGLAPALVLGVEAKRADLLVGPEQVSLPLERAAWAKPWDAEAATNRGRLRDLREVLRAGDLLLVEQGQPEGLALLPGPGGVEGAVLLREVGTGYVRAQVGGSDPDRSIFDRSAQACRQPGSVFKPIYYSAALVGGFTPATLVTDAPLALEQEDSIYPYRARNADRDYRGDMILADALAQSRNIPSLKVYRFVGAEQTLRWAAGLGVTSPLAPVDALALGASCVHPEEMVQAYSTFPEHGLRREPVLLRRVRDASGRVLLDQRHAADPSLLPAEALAKVLAHRPPPRVPGLDEAHAYQTVALLRQVVERGTAAAARKLEPPVAGKTGTTDHYDAWFVGFSAQRVAGVWVGPDENRRVLGRGEHGGKVALPVFSELMAAVHQGLPRRELPGAPPPGVEWVSVDPRTGLRAAKGGASRSLPFLRGTAPEERSPVQGDIGASDLDRLGGSF